ncbi:methyltransferase domain-containing protein [Prochlorococcus sp. MIT 1300]|uniref:methyltransferase domain-containing protein n=1 Tax=Prochlorococcus sp. MIT 1300 TaxID=3096218 RepID=UPI002A765218|nr:methyltransferase domain-containing protein [Prochlorococcus sp. MIT 1300]
MAEKWSRKVISNFDLAAHRYSTHAQLQKDIAKLLAKNCAAQNISKGFWVDLGAGTGFLADAIEKLHPFQKVIRIDGSMRMLEQQTSNSYTQLWDLNLGLPQWPKPPDLIASSFALHWFPNVEYKVKEWFEALSPGGWLAIAVPRADSFPEWRLAANNAAVPCTALQLPSKSQLFKSIPSHAIQWQVAHTVTQHNKEVISLLRPIRQIGAHASQSQTLKVGELRRLIKTWPQEAEKNQRKLTWVIQLLLARK